MRRLHHRGVKLALRLHLRPIWLRNAKLSRNLLRSLPKNVKLIIHFDFLSIPDPCELPISDNLFPHAVGGVVNIHEHVLVLKKSARVSVLRTAVDVKYDVGFPNWKIF